MPETIPVVTPDEPSVTEVQLTAALDSAGRLELSYDGEILPPQDSLEIDCVEDQTVRIVIPDFDNGSQWAVAAAPVTRVREDPPAWSHEGTPGTGAAVDEGSGPSTDFVPVGVTATANGETKEKTIHIKIKTRKTQPGRKPSF